MCEYPSGSVTGFTLFPLAVHTAVFLFFPFSFPEGHGLAAGTTRVQYAGFPFIFVSVLRKGLFQCSTECYGGRLHCVVYLALVVGFLTWNVTVETGDGGWWCQVPSKLENQL